MTNRTFSKHEALDDIFQADVALGAYEQQFAASRDDLVQYALRLNYQWALPGFLLRRGCLDVDWIARLDALGKQLKKRTH